MKTGNSLCGGFMREEFVECYADYYIKFLLAYADHGIHIRALTPQNEPETAQKGRMPACIWHPEIEAKFIKILRKKLDEKGMDVKIWMWDHNFAGVDRVLWSLDNTEGLAESAAGAAFHYYEGSPEDAKKLHDHYPQMELHFTEGGPRLYDNYDTDWCKWAITISKAINCGFKSFTGWNLMLDEAGGPNIGPFFCGGLVTRNSLTGELTYSGQYKAFRHIAKYIKPHSKLHPVSVDETYGKEISAYPKYAKAIEGVFVDNGDGKNILLLINPNSEKKQTQIYLNNIWWYIELMPDSISTIIIED
jgi:glucosylceramidase